MTAATTLMALFSSSKPLLSLVYRRLSYISLQLGKFKHPEENRVVPLIEKRIVGWAADPDVTRSSLIATTLVGACLFAQNFSDNTTEKPESIVFIHSQRRQKNGQAPRGQLWHWIFDLEPGARSDGESRNSRP